MKSTTCSLAGEALASKKRFKRVERGSLLVSLTCVFSSACGITGVARSPANMTIPCETSFLKLGFPPKVYFYCNLRGLAPGFEEANGRLWLGTTSSRLYQRIG